ncbi:MAG: TolB family protein, partial [Actinomycetota bacterium]
MRELLPATDLGVRRLSRRRRVAAVLMTICVLGLLPAAVAPNAEAGPAVRNGRLTFDVRLDQPTDDGPVSAAVADDYDLFSVGPAGASLQRVTSGIDQDFAPAWSPDGRRIVFSRQPPGGLVADIYVMNSDGTGSANLTNSPHHSDTLPEWSADGDRIVFASHENNPLYYPDLSRNQEDLYVMDSDGTNREPLVVEPGIQEDPAFSPDGSWIAYADFPSKAIKLLASDGSRVRYLSRPGRFGELLAAGPEWSRNGKQIVFYTRRGFLAGDSGVDIWVVRADGSGLRNLTAGSPSGEANPTWSPDGEQIAFVSDRDGSWSLYTMQADGSRVRKLLNLDLTGEIYT